MFKTGIRDHESVPMWEFVYSYFEGGKNVLFLLFFFFIPSSAIFNVFLLSNAELLSDPCSSFRGKPLCDLHSFMSCKLVANPDSANFLMVIFKSVSKNGRQFDTASRVWIL